MNLTGLRSDREILIKHFLDSLTPLTLLQPIKGERWIDVGTGAGFPGLVLKIVHPELEMTLLEATGKKAAFLHHFIGLLRLEGVSILQDRLEHLRGPMWEERYDLMLTRAVSPAVILQNGVGLVRSEGRILFFQGPPDASRWEKALKGNRRLALEGIHPVALPFTDEPRSLVLLKVV
ncbi:MAG: 16S rRNA (guanine(527)-N(7))-methyltransferase RsmG [Candidatus Manganitrophus sp. SA1]|nr:16S rRNA (guanine(527)-N(7))-methyltransferase RsmG [Candidatus Manganitrophus morganii]